MLAVHHVANAVFEAATGPNCNINLGVGNLKRLPFSTF